jgi:CubicO group peptidase (beta-lactamase class C family)
VTRLRPLLVAVALIAGACNNSAETGTGAGTTTATAGSVGSGPQPPQQLDPVALDELTTYAEETGSTCLSVLREGEVVHEAYFQGTDAETDQEIYSASKSVTSTLVGIAQHEGHLDIDEPASTYLTEWQGTPSEDLTIRDLLANVSGRFQDLTTDYRDMATQAPDKTQFSLDLDQQHAPGSFWEYNNSAIQTLEAVLERATGEDMAEYAESRLFGPLGMSSTIRRDQAGNPLTFIGVQASCRDLGRFGQFALDEGEWEGEMLVDDGWFAEATAPASELNAAYGYLWWLNRPGRAKVPIAGEVDGPLWEEAPDDAFAALGLGGQTVLVIPSADMVLVRLATGQGGVQGQGDFTGRAVEILFG